MSACAHSGLSMPRLGALAVLLCGAMRIGHAQDVTSTALAASRAQKAAAEQTVARAASAAAAYRVAHPKTVSGVVHLANQAKLKYLRHIYQSAGYPHAGEPAKAPGTTLLVFASKSMPTGQVLGLLSDAAVTPDMRLVFLGGEPHSGLLGLVNWLRGLGAQLHLKHLPDIEIDPPLYAHYHVRWVPTTVMLRNGKTFARVAGVYQPHWVISHAGAHGGNLGSFGTLYRPREINLEAAIRKRIDAFNWSRYVAQARQGFWRHQAMPTIPHARRPVSYLINPTITLTHSIVLPNGTILARAGEQVNPLAHMIFTLRMVVIDASDPAQRTFAANYIKAHPDHPVAVMSTSVPATARHGWRHWAAWTQQIGHRLTLFSPTYAKRFPVSGTPAVIAADHLDLRVQEFVVGGPGGGGDDHAHVG